MPMKISKIEFENFRNFKEHGEIRCSTDGKVTIIYGKIGDGKTTLHQLVQWVFYGKVHFNKTATDRLYNLQYENECSFGETFDVMGCVDFEHDGSQYSLRRTYTYRKGLSDSAKIAEDITLTKMDEDYNWRRMDKPNSVIETLLPSGLSDYFFFDGETMIADLRVKGKDSAGKLRKALYSMFDLDVLEAAIDHIGRTDLKTTVLGKLYLSKGAIASGSQIAAVKTNIENAQNRIDRFTQEMEQATARKAEMQALLVSVSEQIGGFKSKADYERQRKALKTQRDTFLKNATDVQGRFGDAVLDMFPQLLISKAVDDAKQKIHLKVEQDRLPGGITKKLIAYLLDNSTTECICGNPLCAEERKHIQHYLDMLPPRSFTSLYQDFTKTAKSWGRGYDKARIEEFITLVLDNNEQAAICDKHIRELDEAEKKSPDIEDLIVARQQAEQEIRDIDNLLNRITTEQRKLEIYLKKQMQDYDRLTAENKASAKVIRKIEIMEKVVAHFKQRLETESEEYSKRLEMNIQSLVDDMLKTKRKVIVSPEFAVRVVDNYNDESKSEGQFAVVSFAYIGGIFKMLRSEEHLAGKEYPLVLDAPFSKLGAENRQNVVDIMPTFAPQVILFSKDDLHGAFPADKIGYVWTIVSNDEQNVARVEEGHLWN